MHMASDFRDPYSLTTVWKLDAPIGRVWDAIHEVQAWPRWWKYVRAVEVIDRGDSNGIGAAHRFTWSSALPYELCFVMRITEIVKPTRMAGVAHGDLDGMGRWTLREESSSTRVQYDWTVRTTQAWMNVLAPVLTPVFRWNHGKVMAAGGAGLAQHLGARLNTPR